MMDDNKAQKPSTSENLTVVHITKCICHPAQNILLQVSEQQAYHNNHSIISISPNILLTHLFKITVSCSDYINSNGY
jgi:hypothetical protein